jgi:uncharacterized membrane protein YkoI
MVRQTLFASLVLLTVNTAAAYPLPPQDEPAYDGSPLVVSQEAQEREPGPATLEEAIEIAVERYGGELAGAATVERDGRMVHEVRLLVDDTSVRTVRIDPDTGAIIPQAR